MSQPPPLPAEVLKRVQRIAAIDGTVLVVLAGGFGLISAFGLDWLGAVVGALAAAVGGMELNGRRKLQAGEIVGVRWLVRSQLVLLAVILCYAAYQYFYYNPKAVLAAVANAENMINDAQRAQGMEPTTFAESFGLSQAGFRELIKKAMRTTYLSVGLATILCQGGLAYYYHLKSAVIARNLSKS
ncbi:MAG: hypothetical protein QM715_17515 [Nibricoccus sp.]